MTVSLETASLPAVQETELAGICDAGERLDAGMSADRRRREDLKRELIEGLRLARKLVTFGRGACVTAGLLPILCWMWLTFYSVSFPRPVEEPPTLLTAAGGELLLGAGVLLAGGALLGWAGRMLARWQRYRGRWLKVEIPAEPSFSPPAAPYSGDGSAAEEDRQSLLQYRLEWAYADELSAGLACELAGKGSLVVLPFTLYAAMWPEGVADIPDPLIFVCLISALPMVILPLGALGSVISWCRRRHLLMLGKREGLDLRDPARDLWE